MSRFEIDLKSSFLRACNRGEFDLALQYMSILEMYETNKKSPAIEG